VFPLNTGVVAVLELSVRQSTLGAFVHVEKRIAEPGLLRGRPASAIRPVSPPAIDVLFL
jgi:hypothetical protein